MNETCERKIKENVAEKDGIKSIEREWMRNKQRKNVKEEKIDSVKGETKNNRYKLLNRENMKLNAQVQN